MKLHHTDVHSTRGSLPSPPPFSSFYESHRCALLDEKRFFFLVECAVIVKKLKKTLTKSLIKNRVF